MSSVLDRSALAESPLADLHLLANELGVDGFRRLRKSELVDAIVARQSDEPVAAVAAVAEAEPEERPEERSDDDEPRRGRRGRRGGRGRARGRDEDGERPAVADEAPAPASGGGGGGERTVEGVVELLANGSGFLRLSPPEESDEDVYILSLIHI